VTYRSIYLSIYTDLDTSIHAHKYEQIITKIMYLRVRVFFYSYDSAASWYKEVLFHNDKEKSALKFLGFYYHQIGNYNEAIYYFNEILIYDKNEEYYFLLGLSYQYSGIYI
jgi:tetratricopeptide (TPR) repeat protein